MRFYPLLSGLALMLLMPSPAWSKRHPFFKAGRATGVRTHQNSKVIGQVVVSTKPIPKASAKPAGLVESMTFKQGQPTSIATRTYYPTTMGKIIEAISNPSKKHDVVTEVWIDGKVVQRFRWWYKPHNKNWNTSSFADDRGTLKKKLARLRPGAHKVIFWVYVEFREQKPHPATGTPRYVRGSIYLAKGKLAVNVTP